jgi:hypothetical protein
MEAVGLFFSRFSDELVSAQIAALSLSLALGVYWMLVRKKKRESAEWVPAALVRAYLDRVRAEERDIRIKLFGEDVAAPAAMPLTQMLSAGGQATVTQLVQDPALQKEVEALRAQLATADSRAMEFDRNLNGLRAEKAALEQKLKDAATAGGTPAGAADPAMLRELEDLRARIAEYDVVSEEIANIKILQKENEKLKQEVTQLKGGAAPTLSVVPGGAAPAPEATTVPNAAAKVETPVTVVSAEKPAEAAPAAAAPVAAPVAAAAAPVAAAPAAPAEAAPAPAAAEANTNVLTPVSPTLEAAPAAEKSSKQKEEELLSEFEKMLAS